MFGEIKDSRAGKQIQSEQLKERQHSDISVLTVSLMFVFQTRDDCQRRSRADGSTGMPTSQEAAALSLTALPKPVSLIYVSSFEIIWY